MTQTNTSTTMYESIDYAFAVPDSHRVGADFNPQAAAILIRSDWNPGGKLQHQVFNYPYADASKNALPWAKYPFPGWGDIGNYASTFDRLFGDVPAGFPPPYDGAYCKGNDPGDILFFRGDKVAPFSIVESDVLNGENKNSTPVPIVDYYRQPDILEKLGDPDTGVSAETIHAGIPTLLSRDSTWLFFQDRCLEINNTTNEITDGSVGKIADVWSMQGDGQTSFSNVFKTSPTKKIIAAPVVDPGTGMITAEAHIGIVVNMSSPSSNFGGLSVVWYECDTTSRTFTRYLGEHALGGVYSANDA